MFFGTLCALLTTTLIIVLMLLLNKPIGGSDKTNEDSTATIQNGMMPSPFLSTQKIMEVSTTFSGFHDGTLRRIL